VTVFGSGSENWKEPSSPRNNGIMHTRREFLAGAIPIIAFKNDTLRLVESLIAKTGEVSAEDEQFWMQIQEAFTLDRTMINFNNGGVCPSPRVVQDALIRYLQYQNQAPSFFMWRNLEPEIESVRKRLARAFGCDGEEIAITRNASEALEICLNGFDLKPGDEILTTNQDYPRMITTIKQRELREGVKMVQVNPPPTPKTQQELLRAIENGITEKTKLILICQVIFMTGQIYPVRDICRMAAKRNIPVIVDGAHAFAQFPFLQSDLECEFYGTSLHKWLMAPIGTGMLFVKNSRIETLWPLMAANKEQAKDIRKFEEIGTHPAANHNAIAEALTFHELIGPQRKAERLRYLRSRWTTKLINEPKVHFTTNLSPEHSCGITTVNISGIKSADLAAWLWDKHRIFVTTIAHDQFEGIRVTPNVYTTLDEIDRFSAAMLTAAKQGIA